ncbi:aminodeoxychorismate synthase component I, partial [Acinetobacter baumannii]|nr:aminodeoxychorismate synthase component I [Acinetobacter baumannii]
MGRNYFTPSPTTPEGRQRSGSRKMLSPAIITLPWRPDAAEHYFAPLSALPWA